MLIYPSRNLWCIGKKNMLLLIDCDCKYVTSSFSRSLSISNVTVLSLNIPSEKSVLSTFYFTTVTLSTTFLFLSSNSTHNFFISVSNLSTFYFTSSSAASLCPYYSIYLQYSLNKTLHLLERVVKVAQTLADLYILKPF